MLLDVKTGNAGLNSIQKKIEAAAVEKRVSFEVLRINEPGDNGVQEARESSVASSGVQGTLQWAMPRED